MAFENLGYDIRYQIYRHLIPNLEIHYPHIDSLTGEGLTDRSLSKPNLQYGIVLANKQFSEEFLEFAYKQSTFVFAIKQRNTADFRHWPVTSSVLQNVRFCRFLDTSESNGAWTLPKEIHLPLIMELLPSLRRMELEVLVNPNITEKEGRSIHVAARFMPFVLQRIVTEIPCGEFANIDPTNASYVW